MRSELQVNASDAARAPQPLGMARIYTLARNVFSVLGLLVILSIAVPDARDVLLRSLLWTPWKKEFGNWHKRDAQRTEPWLALGTGDTGSARSAASAADEATAGYDSLTGPEHPGFRRASLHVREQLAVTSFIAKRYRVADDIVARFVAVAHRAGIDQAVDPMLVLAVMAVESRYNPIAESVMGARGLMQIIPKYHLDKLSGFGGPDALLDPDVNILVGARILSEYIGRFRDTEMALQMYAGALDEPTQQYSRKVLAERSRLQQVLQRTRREA